MAPAQVIDAKDLPPEVQGVAAGQAALGEAPAQHQPQVLATKTPPTSAAPTPAAAVQTPATGGVPMPPEHGRADWESGVAIEAAELLAAGHTDVWNVLTRRFESRLIQSALENTRGRRIEAAHKLGIGRNTITRKMHDLGLD